jgi:four helix bundle protein
MQDFKKLAVWAKAHELVLEVYRTTSRLPERGYPGLISQLRRAAASIPANIVEGCAHTSQGEFARFLQHASASALEVAYHLLLARDLGALTATQYARLEARTLQVRQMLGGLLRRVRLDLAEHAAKPRTRACSAHDAPTADSVERKA